jgi:hypothetical protein
MATDSPNDAHWHDLQSAYAEAMWASAQIEASIFTIYLAAIGALSLDMRPIRESFFRNDSFRARLRMTHAAMAIKWAGSSHLATWNELHRRCDNTGRDRGSIAHLAGHSVPPDKPHRKKTLYVLLEPCWDYRHPDKWGEAKARGIDAVKLREFAREWSRLNYDVSQLANELWREAMLQASDESQPD